MPHWFMWKYFNQYTFSPTKLLATISSWTLGISGDFAYKLWKKLEWYCIYDILEIESIFDDMWWPKSCYLASNYIDFKRLIIKLFVAMILHIFVCCTSLCFSTRPQKCATLPPSLTEVLLLNRTVSKKGGRVAHLVT